MLTPPDFDPEEHDEVFDGGDDFSSESDDESQVNARDHYEDIGYEPISDGVIKSLKEQQKEHAPQVKRHIIRTTIHGLTDKPR